MKITFTLEEAHYWARSAVWSAREAAHLLLGVDPRKHKAPQDAIQTILSEIDRCNWFASGLWDAWTPKEWLEAAGNAGIAIPEVLREAVLDGQPRKPNPVPTDSKLLAVIAALLAEWPGGRLPSAKDLEKAAQSVGIDISDDTIRKALRAAREIAQGLPGDDD